MTIAVGCSSTSADSRSRSGGTHKALDPTTARSSVTTRRGPALQRPLPAQFSIDEAHRLTPPSQTDQTGIVALARGAEPTRAELAAAQHAENAMSSMAKSPPISMTPRLRADLDAAQLVSAHYPTARDAAAAGYILASRFIPGIGAHWIRWSLVHRRFDAAHPAMLLFDGNGLNAKLAGLSYFVQSLNVPLGFVDGHANWHRHVGLCIVNGRLVAEQVVRRSACDGGNGALIAGRDVWMAHLWTVPGWVNPDGEFATINRALCAGDPLCAGMK